MTGTAPLASSPCAAGEGAPAYVDPQGADPDLAARVADWRRGERKRLRALREGLTVSQRGAWGQALAAHLRGLFASWPGGIAGRVVSGYWPIKGEADLRGLLADLHAAGATIALPVVETRGAPLVFRHWQPGQRMVRGHWDIPVPPPHAAVLRPEIAFAPLVGWDSAGFRLGYGGGYFDRTLAAPCPRPVVLGIGLQATRLASIRPLPHDVAMDAILTEAGLQVTGPRWPGPA
jgi:5,10-methenyltetrahydrofolate synthetase